MKEASGAREELIFEFYKQTACNKGFQRQPENPLCAEIWYVEYISPEHVLMRKMYQVARFMAWVTCG